MRRRRLIIAKNTAGGGGYLLFTNSPPPKCIFTESSGQGLLIPFVINYHYYDSKLKVVSGLPEFFLSFITLIIHILIASQLVFRSDPASIVYAKTATRLRFVLSARHFNDITISFVRRYIFYDRLLWDRFLVALKFLKIVTRILAH